MDVSRSAKHIKGEKIDIHQLIGKIPIIRKKGLLLYKHKYTGPYNPLDKQLDEKDRPISGQEPYNNVDAISLKHDICYRDEPQNKYGCDAIMLKELKSLKANNLREKIDKQIVRAIIGTKHKLGWGVVWSDQLADELHRPIKRKFIKRKVFASNVDSIWAADLVEVGKLAKFNKGYKYLLTVIDIFSKYGWMLPIKNKTGECVAQALNIIFQQGRSPSRLWTDKGKEFYNRNVQNLLDKYKILLYSTENEEKASVVERWNRTMKQKMWKYFTANNTHNYLEILPKLVEHYNTTRHRSIKNTPKNASLPENYSKTFDALYPTPQKLKRKNAKFKIGDTVRLARKKDLFEKGFTTNWTEEQFTINKVLHTRPWTYKVVDKNNEEVHGSFYEEELQKSKQAVYRIEKLLKKRTNKQGKTEIYVKWKGYSNSFNSWISTDKVENYGS